MVRPLHPDCRVTGGITSEAFVDIVIFLALIGLFAVIGFGSHA